MASLDNQETESEDQPPPDQHRHRWPAVLKRGVRLFALGYLAICVLLMILESRLIYPGAYLSSGPQIDWSAVGIEQVSYQSADGTPLTGTLLHRDGAEHAVLFFHGNGTKAVWSDDWLRRLSSSLNASVMAAEYRGYCDDGVTPTEAGVIADCHAARDYLCRRYDLAGSDLILYGQSLGGGCAVALAADGGAKVLVLDRTFVRLVDVAADRHPLLPIRWMIQNRYDSAQRITEYRGPLIQIHGTADQIIPIRYGKRLYEAADCSPKHWHEVAGMGHNDWLPSSALAEVVALIEDITTDESPHSASSDPPSSSPPSSSPQ